MHAQGNAYPAPSAPHPSCVDSPGAPTPSPGTHTKYLAAKNLGIAKDFKKHEYGRGVRLAVADGRRKGGASDPAPGEGGEEVPQERLARKGQAAAVARPDGRQVVDHLHAHPADGTTLPEPVHTPTAPRREHRNGQHHRKRATRGYATRGSARLRIREHA